MEVVLERRAGEQQTEGDGKAGERGAKGRGLVLEPMALVDRDRVEEEALREERLLLTKRVVGGQVHIKDPFDHVLVDHNLIHAIISWQVEHGI